MENRNLQVPVHGAAINGDVTTWALPDGAIARLGRGRVEALAFSPDSKYLAVGTWIGVWWYELSTMSPVALWETERGVISALDFSPNGQWLATGNLDGTVKVWALQRGTCVARMEVPAYQHENGPLEFAISGIAFSGDSQHIATSAMLSGRVYIWRAETGTQIAKFSPTPEITVKMGRPVPRVLRFSPDGQLLAYASPGDADRTADFIAVWNVSTGNQIASFKGHTALISALAFSPDGQFLASSDLSGTLREWDVTTGTQVRMSSEYAGKYQTIPSYSASGSLHTAAGEGQSALAVWNVESGEKLYMFRFRGAIRAVCFSNGAQLAVSSLSEFKVWSADTAPTVTSIPRHTHAMLSLTFSPDGQTLACVGGGPATCWDIVQKRPQQTISRVKTEIRSIHITPAEKMRALGSAENTLSVWDVETDETIAAFAEHPKLINVATFAPTGEQWASGDIEGNLYIWDGKDKQMTLYGHTDSIRCLAFSPDGQYLASTSRDKTARVWDVASGQEIASLLLTPSLDETTYKGDSNQIQRQLKLLTKADTVHRHRRIVAIAFSPCGNLIAGGLWREIRLWDATTYEIRMSIFPPHGCQQPYALAFSPCGRYLASGAWWQGTEKTSIRLWEVASGENIATFWGHPTDIQSLTFSPDGALLASGSYDGTILLWDMKPYL